MRIVEASLVMPLTILIMAALIGLMMSFYAEFGEQLEHHAEEREELYSISEATYIRAYDRLSAAAETTDIR